MTAWRGARRRTGSWTSTAGTTTRSTATTSPPGARPGGSETDPIRRTLHARWGIVAAPALLYIFSYLHRVAPVVVAGALMQAFAIPAAALGTLITFTPTASRPWRCPAAAWRTRWVLAACW